MFTGVVKLAQIDDYITPAQNCIQPKIMKKSGKQTKATVTLNDCLACSGCITSAESVLVDQMSLSRFKELLKEEKQVHIIVSPQSLLSMSYFYSFDLETMFNKLKAFFKSNFPSIRNIYNESEGIKISHELIFNQYQERVSRKQPILCSECPGWVCYAEKTLSQEITQYMSQVKSPQQIMARLIKDKYGPHCKVISIMPCFDKKLQAIRFNFDEKTKELDLTLATNQMQNLLTEFGEGCFNCEGTSIEKNQKQSSTTNLLLSENRNFNTQLNILNDQASNGYVSFLLGRLGAKNITEKNIKNSDFMEISGELEDGSEVKMVKCYGFRNIQKVVSLIKRKKCQYSYVEVMACPGGCYSGGGQIRYEEKKQKDIVCEFKQIEKPYQIPNDSSVLERLCEEEVELIKKYDFSTDYKPIEKSFTSTVMNW